jgi:hypothetical protein
MGAFPRNRSNNCYLCQSLKIAGFAGASPGRNLEVVPTLTASRTDVRSELPDGPLVDGDLDTELGVTARWGMTPNLTLSGAVNPDFSQVEADARQLDINEPFALFYKEKRPFFMEGDDYFNRVAGLDGDFRITVQDRITVQLLGSSTRYPDEVAAGFDQPARSFDDVAAELIYQHQTRTVDLWCMYDDVGSDFRADLGFMPRVDYRFAEVGAGYTWNATPSSWYSRIDLDLELNRIEDQAGSLLGEEAEVQLTVQGPLESVVALEPSYHREGYAGEQFELRELALELSLRPSRNSEVWAELALGGQIDCANVREGDAVNLELGLVYSLGRHLRLAIEDIHETMDVDRGWLYGANIAQLEATWQLDVRTFLRAILQPVAYDYNSELYADGRGEREEELYSQLLFSYKVNPRTVVFVGYSEDAVGNAAYDLTPASRSIFAKLGYAWVL